MTPPQPSLDWDTVVNYTYLSQFELLRDCREDVREREWATPAARMVSQSYLKVHRAEEEIARLNIEVRRLYTWMKDEYWYLQSAMKAVETTEPLISKEIALLLNRHVAASAAQNYRITQILALPGYTGGSLEGGIRQGLASINGDYPQFTTEVEDPDYREAELRPRLPEDDEEISEQIARLDDYVDSVDS